MVVWYIYKYVCVAIDCFACTCRQGMNVRREKKKSTGIQLGLDPGTF